MTAEHFFVVGAQRSGTTYLYKALDAHPAICMARPVQPEPKFFLKPDLADYSLDDYLNSCFDRSACILRGEKGTTYLESELAARQIAEWFPAAKIIMILRDPIDRAISNYHFSCNNKLEDLPIERAFREEPLRRDTYDHARVSASPYAYLQRGHYLDYIRVYEKYFPREQMMILIHEEFIGKVEAVQQLFTWLGVEPDTHHFDVTTIVNPSKKTASALSKGLEDYLIAHFAPSVAELERYLGRALTVWSRFQRTD